MNKLKYEIQKSMTHYLILLGVKVLLTHKLKILCS